ncbi:MAG: hypothetical protein AVDCRST_MAG90-684, partial [uncultured Microvirga sp.]
EVARHPLAPAQLQAHPHVDEADGCGRCRHRKTDDRPDAGQHGADILAFDRVEKEAVPPVDAERRKQIGEHEGENAERQKPGKSLGWAAPEPARDAEI